MNIYANETPEEMKIILSRRIMETEAGVDSKSAIEVGQVPFFIETGSSQNRQTDWRYESCPRGHIGELLNI